MNILGIDPGATSGWCVYDTDSRAVLYAGTFANANRCEHMSRWISECHDWVIERPVAHGPTRPQVVDCAWVAGRLAERWGCKEITRLDVRQRLTAAMHGTVRVVNDGTAKAALKQLHGGEDSAKKGGPLYGLRGTSSHGWAALAVAVAYSLPPATS